MDETPAPDHGDAPRPGSRFPWVQLVFCAACLSMAAWAWMRYSYAWDVTPRQLPYARALGAGDGNLEEQDDALAGMFVRLRGSVVRLGLVRTYLRDGSCQLADCVFVKNLTKTDRGIIDCPIELVLVELPQGWPYAINEDAEYAGRLEIVQAEVDVTPGAKIHYRICMVDAAASRFHPASVSGLAVGAMGAFIFALYLRRWLSERRAGRLSA